MKFLVDMNLSPYWCKVPEGAERPSVILIRTKNITPDSFAPVLITAIKNNHEVLETGAILVMDDDRERVRILPLQM
jgi:predicted nuclease of predicted toxin-antitoxin system